MPISKIKWNAWEEICTFMKDSTLTVAEHDGLTDIEANMINASLMTMQTSIRLIGLVLKGAKVRERLKKREANNQEALTLTLLEGMSQAGRPRS